MFVQNVMQNLHLKMVNVFQQHQYSLHQYQLHHHQNVMLLLLNIVIQFKLIKMVIVIVLNALEVILQM